MGFFSKKKSPPQSSAGQQPGARSRPINTHVSQSQPGPSSSVAQSTATTPSATPTVKEVMAISSTIKQMEDEINLNTGIVASLKTWAGTIPPETYSKHPWATEMERKYANYKALVEAISPKQTAFQQANRQIKPRTATASQHLQLANLAIQWGQAALSAAHARLQFLVSFRNAYEDVPDIDNHIGEAESHVNGAQNALTHAKKNYQNLWNTVAGAKPL